MTSEDRSQWVRWIHNRIPSESSFDPALVVDWLETQDPSRYLFESLTDILDVCGVAHESGDDVLKNRGLEEMARTWFTLLPGKQREETPGSHWLQENIQKLLSDVTAARFNDMTLALLDGLTESQWTHLVPDDLTPPSSKDDIALELEKLVQETKKPSRERTAKQVGARLAGPQPGRTVRILIDANVLRTSWDRKLELAPKWLLVHFFIEHVKTFIRENHPREWGVFVVDPDRRAFIDHVIDECIDAETLIKVAEELVAKVERHHMGYVAAVNTLFEAVARRWAEGKAVNIPATTLQKLMEAQIALLPCRRRDRFDLPVLRPLHPEATYKDTQIAQQEWMAHCWEWSFRVECSIEPADKWLFPGMQDELSLDEAAFRLPRELEANKAHERLLKRAEELWPRCVHDIPLNKTPGILLFARFFDHVQSDEELDLEFCKHVASRPALLMNTILPRMNDIEPGHAELVARGLFLGRVKAVGFWDAVRKWEGCESLHADMIEQIGPSVVEEALSEKPAVLDHVEAIWLNDLHEKFHATVVQQTLDRVGHWYPHEDLKYLVQDPGSHRALSREACVLLANHEKGRSWPNTERIWKSHPDVVHEQLEKLDRNDPKDTDEWAYWLGGAPDEVLENVLALAEELPAELHGDWLAKWTRRQLVKKPHLAQRLWNLTHK